MIKKFINIIEVRNSDHSIRKRSPVILHRGETHSVSLLIDRRLFVNFRADIDSKINGRMKEINLQHLWRENKMLYSCTYEMLPHIESKSKK